MVCPAAKVSFDVPGFPLPVQKIVRWPGAVAVVTVVSSTSPEVRWDRFGIALVRSNEAVAPVGVIVRPHNDIR